jgi:hypothetical protein
MSKHDLPDFHLNDYEQLLIQLKQVGYSFVTASNMGEQVGSNHDKKVFLRHDIDLHLYRLDEVASIENKHGVTATYYILLNTLYNPLQKKNYDIIRKLVAYGHEIGLHYDLETYPEDTHKAKEHLDWEISILEKLAGVKVQSIVMHQPFKGNIDLFKESATYIHPHHPTFDSIYTYISDSCRAWRDTKLSDILQHKTQVQYLHLNTHPELWLGNQKNRLTFLEDELSSNVNHFNADYMEYVKHVWQTHSAPKMHDERESQIN